MVISMINGLIIYDSNAPISLIFISPAFQENFFIIINDMKLRTYINILIFLSLVTRQSAALSFAIQQAMLIEFGGEWGTEKTLTKNFTLTRKRKQSYPKGLS